MCKYVSLPRQIVVLNSNTKKNEMNKIFYERLLNQINTGSARASLMKIYDIRFSWINFSFSLSILYSTCVHSLLPYQINSFKTFDLHYCHNSSRIYRSSFGFDLWIHFGNFRKHLSMYWCFSYWYTFRIDRTDLFVQIFYRSSFPNRHSNLRIGLFSFG